MKKEDYQIHIFLKLSGGTGKATFNKKFPQNLRYKVLHKKMTLRYLEKCYLLSVNDQSTLTILRIWH